MKKKLSIILVSVLVVAAASVTTILLLGKDKPFSAPNGSTLPQLSNPDAVFFEGDGFSITYGEIYEQFKANDGINQMLYMIDTHLLATELAAVTAEQIDAKIKYLPSAQVEVELALPASEKNEAILEDYLPFMVSSYLRILRRAEKMAENLSGGIDFRKSVTYSSFLV